MAKQLLLNGAKINQAKHSDGWLPSLKITWHKHVYFFKEMCKIAITTSNTEMKKILLSNVSIDQGNLLREQPLQSLDIHSDVDPALCDITPTRAHQEGACVPRTIAGR